VIEEVQLAVNAGVKEAVLTGAQLGSWGKDLYPPLRLIDLINGILEKTSIDRLRLSSVEPWEIHEDFFPLLENPRFCRHLHLPLQSGSSAVLKRMRRPITPEKYQDLISSIRKANKNVALSTDLIVGFPGETEAEFSETLKFVQCLQFAGGHVFSFSPRPQTQAASLPGQVSPGIKKERSRILRGMISDSAFHFRESQKNQIQKVLWEKSTPLEGGLFELEGLSDNYLRVTGISHDNLWNCISAVKLVEIQGKTSRGKIIGPCHTSLMRQSRVSD